MFGGLVLLSFLIKLVVVWQLKDHPMLQADAGLDTTAYLTLADRAAHGDWLLGPQAYFVSPLYIYFLAPILWAGGSLTAVRVVQIVFGAAAIACVFVAAREWFGTRAAWVAAVLLALTGTVTFAEALIVQAALDPFLIAAALAALALAETRDRPRWFFAAGVLFGVATLNRPNILAAALVVAAAPKKGTATIFREKLWLSPFSSGRGWTSALVFVAGLALALAPVAVRNGVVAGDWSPLPTQGGLNFYIGNNPAANGEYRPVPGIRPTVDGQQFDARDVASRALGHAVGDREASSYFYRQGFAWIAESPRSAARLFARKLALLFNRANVVLNYSYPFFAYDERTLLMALPVGAWLLVPLGLFGLFVGGRRMEGGRRTALVAFVVTYSLATAAFFVSDRYRLPLLIPMAIAAGGAIDWILDLVLARRGGSEPVGESKRRPALHVLALIGLFAFANWPMRADDGRAEERARMAEKLIEAGDYSGAEDWAARASAGYPRQAVLDVRIGNQFMQVHEWQRALSHYERAASLEPNEPEVQFRLGQALSEAGRSADAIPHLRAAIAADPSRALAGYELARALAATGDREGALRALDGAHAIAGNSAQNHVSFGELAMRLDDPRMAERFFRLAIAETPSLAAAHRQLGLVLGLEGRSADAIDELTDAVRLDPADPSAHLNLAVAYAQVGRTVEARGQAEQALRLSPSYVQAQQLLTALAHSRH